MLLDTVDLPSFANGTNSDAMSANSTTSSMLSKSLDKMLHNSTSSLDDNVKSIHHNSILNCPLRFRIISESGSNNLLANLGQRYNTLLCNENEKTSSDNAEQCEDGIPTPKLFISDPNDVKLTWTKLCPVGSGLKNLGNSCFMNSVLQCLTYLSPLYSYLVESNHFSSCCYKGFCSLCEVQKHISRTLQFNGNSISPTFFFNNLLKIGNFTKYRQEDAHEFLRFLLCHMEKCSVENFKSKHQGLNLDSASLRTTAINNIFGGYNRSQVVCMRCKKTSNTYDPFMDIMLDIKNADSLDNALAKYTRAEMLEGENAYHCEHCKARVNAQKRVTFHRLPAVATFHLKRFQFHYAFGTKIGKWIKFPEKLNLRPYMSNSKGQPVTYLLRGIVVHLGNSMQNGHYCAYIRNSKGNFYCMNDESVSSVDKNTVFSQQAYILFYSKIVPVQKNDASTVNGHSGNTSALKIKMNASSKLDSNDRTETNVATTQSHIIKEQNGHVTSRVHTTSAHQSKINGNVSQPRIVIKIKNGRVNNVNDKNDKSSQLVPYTADDSDDDYSSNRKVSVDDTKNQPKSNEPSLSSGIKYINDKMKFMNFLTTPGVDKNINRMIEKSSDKKLLSALNINTTTATTVPLFKRVRRLSGSLPPSSSLQSPLRVNFRSKSWSVANQNQTPSVESSSSSTTSINSTVENWTVSGYDRGSPNPDKRVCPGWKVQASPVKRYVNGDVKTMKAPKSVSSTNDQESANDKAASNLQSLEATKSTNLESDDVRTNVSLSNEANTKCPDDRSSYDSPPKRAKTGYCKYSRWSSVRDDNDESSNSSYEVEWIEKTKETIDKQIRDSSKIISNDTVNGEVSHSEKSYSSKNHSHNHSEHTWLNNGDGDSKHNRFNNTSNHHNHESDVVNNLLSNSTQGYGSSVMSWNGNDCELNVDVEKEKRFKRLRDDYDEDFDRGKVKKLKKYAYDHRTWQKNPFQTAYEKSSTSYHQYNHHQWQSRENYHSHNNHHRDYEDLRNFRGKSHSFNYGSRQNNFRRHNSYHHNNNNHYRWDRRR